MLRMVGKEVPAPDGTVCVLARWLVRHRFWLEMTPAASPEIYSESGPVHTYLPLVMM